MSCTSPPPALWRWRGQLVQQLDHRDTRYSATRLSTASTRSEKLLVSSGQCIGSRKRAAGTIASHSTRPSRSR